MTKMKVQEFNYKLTFRYAELVVCFVFFITG